jgi:valyl-tRNA synthetase
MDKTYDPQAIEQAWYATWEKNGWFAPQGEGAPYCIMIPPPNVTGTLHMGHGFNNTVMDALIRYHRMRGHDTLWQPGTDHAGIATQMVVERQLEAEGKNRHDLGREAFIERVWEWREQSGGSITRQLRRMGASLDWAHERFTMDAGLSRAVTEVFVRLHDAGLIYRGQRLVNWDPVLHTAVSDLEVVSQEEQGHLWHMRYPRCDGQGFVVVATTRPETMLGDTAVAVHPDDDRYRDLVGQRVELPLTGRTIPVIADAYVDPAFGTGCVKITPAHDFNDYAIGQRHDLELINILTVDARINDHAPEKYRGLDRFDARQAVVADLEAAGLLEKVDPHRLMVPRGDRSHSVIEPFLTDQWFVDLTRETQDDGRPGGLAAITRPALDAVADGNIRFIPGNWVNTYNQWLENIQDWCISRQIWWGHRIPAWYDDAGRIYVGESEAAVRSRHRLADDIALRQDDDVLDTWFSSALWPFSTLGWPDETARLKSFYPTSLLVTGFDIIFFWVARMIMFGLYFKHEVPFREVYIHGLVRDAHGQKMSKSKGNVLDPIDLIDGIDLDALVEKRTRGLMQPQQRARIEQQTRAEFPAGIPAFGTDALRFTFAALASPGRDINFDLGRVEGYRNFCNKLWNAARFVLMHTEDQDCGDSGGALELSTADRWIVSRLQRTVERVTEQFAAYRLDLVAQALYEFTWNEYCDWYLELAKPQLQGEATTAAAKRGTRRTLVSVLETLLRLTHPLMPFISEAVWQQVAPLAGKSGPTIMLQPFPEAEKRRLDPRAEAELEWLMACVLGVRQIRSGMDIAPSKALPLLVQNADADTRTLLAAHGPLLQSLARLESLTVLADDQPAPEAATSLVGDLRLLIPLAGLIDTASELARLDKEIARLEETVGRVRAKLDNAQFVAKAPAAVVDKERAKIADAQSALAQLGEQRARIAAL